MKLKRQSNYYNFQQRTIGDFFRDGSDKGWWATISDRLAWGKMRMDPTDLADVTGYTYTYLINGLPPEANWTALFRPGERVRLRFINGSTQSYFNVRMPGLEMTVVQADGQNVEPVTVDEFQIAVAETYDVIVAPKEDRAYTLFAESMDRSGYTRGTLAPQAGMSAPIPELRPPPLRTMIDMGMDMGDMGNMTGMDMDAKAGGGHAGHMAGMGMDAGSTAGGGQMGAMPGMGEKVGPVVARQGPNRYGPGNTMVPTVLRNRLGEPGTGLENVGHRVLVYTDLHSLKPGSDQREPEREVELHLTGNMDNYMWSFDGQKFSEVRGPIPFYYGERLRFTMVNDTMMEHPIHLHGMFMELDNGSGSHKPRKHTISVKPAERLSLDITADAPGNWALHCHLLYHMEMGMFRVVNVSRRMAEGDT
jgi:CopA family copper-resistance protein